MHKVVTVLVLLFVLSSHNSYRAEAGGFGFTKESLERTRDVLLYTAGFSLFDYIGYNLANQGNDNHMILYRIIQSGVKAGIIYDLYRRHGARGAVSFGIMWWTGGADMMYYGWAYLLNVPGFEGRERTARWFRADNMGHLWWTPLGTVRGTFLGREGSGISPNEFAWQVAIGAGVALFTVNIEF